MYQWNAKDYAENSSAQQTWALELLTKLCLLGNEQVLDIGCGDGKITAELAHLLPGGRALGIDSSPDMIRLAKSKFPETLFSNLRFEVCDARELRFQQEFDVLFSNAALHWIVDHKPVLAGANRALKPGGRLLFQMAGKGNAADLFRVLEQLLGQWPWKPYFQQFEFPYGFYAEQEYAKWLETCGFIPMRVELIPKLMLQENKEKLQGWMRTTWLPYTQRLPLELREPFIQAAVDQYVNEFPADDQGRIRLAMVRLEVEARKKDVP